MSAATQIRSLAPLAESLIWWHGGAARRFNANRTADVSTVSGLGVVALVTECANGLVVTQWRDHADGTPGNVEISVSVAAWLTFHGHDGATSLVKVAL